MSDPFAPPAARLRGAAPPASVAVAPGDVARAPPAVRRALARALRRPTEEVASDAALGRWLVVGTGDPMAMARASGLIGELVGLEARRIGRPDPLGAGMTAASGLGALALSVLTIGSSTSWGGAAALAILVTVALGWVSVVGPLREQEALRIARPAAATDDPDPAASAQAAGDPIVGLGVLAGAVLRATRGSPEALAWLSLAAAQLDAVGEVGRAALVRERILREHGVRRGRAVGSPPWRDGHELVWPLDDAELGWPRVCPFCNRPGTRPVVLRIVTRPEAPPTWVAVALFLGLGLLGFTRTDYAIPGFVCDDHASQRAIAGLARWGGPVVFVAGSWLGSAGVVPPVVAVTLAVASGAAAIWGFWLAPAGFEGTDTGDGLVRFTGAHPDFVRDRPELGP